MSAGPRAHRAVARAVRDGHLVRPGKCGQCGASCRPDAHHPDYARPLDVRWLCRSCHRRLHSQCAGPSAPLVSLSVRVKRETAEKLRKIADAHYRPVAAELRRLIEDHVEREEGAAA